MFSLNSTLLYYIVIIMCNILNLLCFSIWYMLFVFSNITLVFRKVLILF